MVEGEVDYRQKYIESLELDKVRLQNEVDILKAELFQRHGVGTTTPSFEAAPTLPKAIPTRRTWDQIRGGVERRRHVVAREQRKEKESIA